MMKINVKAYAKINLSIDIVSRMDDGYHNMRMIMQSVALHDAIAVAVKKGDGISVRTDLRYLPCDDRNIAARAASVYYAHTGITGYHTSINIEKQIPVCAGLGGGSTDGAAVLRALNELHATGLRLETLQKLAEEIGSDVPFCVAGGTALAEGRGEVLTDLPPLCDCHIVICKPAFAISTPELFSKINVDKIRLRPNTDSIIEALGDRNVGKIARRMYNVFEDVLPKGTSAIDEIKQCLLDNASLGAVMTGTGSAVFGLFDDEDAARAAYDELNQTYKECYLTEPVGKLEV